MQIIILGMHRSGTSPLARLINLMGAYVGAEGTLMEPNRDNPKGFWERNDVYALHQEVLKAIGASWHEIAAFDLSKLAEEERVAFERKAQMIVQNLDAHRPWVMKDPRLCLLVPLWQPLLEAPICVHIYRSPLQVAQSLRTRNGFPIHFGAALWEKYNLLALAQSRELPRLFVSHQRLLAQPLETVGGLYEQLLALGVQGLRLPSEREIRAFLDPALYRERGEAGLEREFINLSQQFLFQVLEAGVSSEAAGLPALSAGAQEALERHDIEERRERQRGAEVQKLQQRLTEAEQVRGAEVQKLQQRLTEAEQVRGAEVQKLQQRLTEAEQVRGAEVQKLQQRLTEAERRRGAEVQALQQCVTESEQRRSVLTAEARALRQQVDEGGQEQSRLRRIVQEKAADIVELQKAVEKTTEDFTAAQRQAEEGRVFQTLFTGAEQTIVAKNQEITTLREDMEDMKEQAQEINFLVRHVGQLDRAITNILESKRWKLGDRLGALNRKIRFKSALSNPQAYQEQMRKELQSWFQDRKKKSTR